MATNSIPKPGPIKESHPSGSNPGLASIYTPDPALPVAVAVPTLKTEPSNPGRNPFIK